MTVNLMALPLPNAADASAIAAGVLGEQVASADRLPTGAANWVFAVTAARTARRVVVRIMRDPAEAAGGVALNQKLRPLGVPLPELIAYHLPSAEAGERAWMVLEHFEGTDLGNVYPSLNATQRLAILDHVCRAQSIVRDAVPPPTTFGYADGFSPPPHAAWADVVLADLKRSRGRIERAGALSTTIVDRVRDRVRAERFDDIAPTPFLDDATTKNVIVDAANGTFRGIVDVDSLCYGDPLFVVALTRMSLLARGWPTDYADAWFHRFDASRKRLDLYTAVFGVNFLSELGEQFNAAAPPTVDPAQAARLTAIVNSLLSGLG
jgi:hypothetical protein